MNEAIYLEMFDYRKDAEMLKELQAIDKENGTKFAKEFKKELEQKYPDLVLN